MNLKQFVRDMLIFFATLAVAIGGYLANVMSITTDRGHEFTNFDVASFLKDHNVDVYYTHAYLPSEKGMIERINRDIRAYFPKKTSFASVTPAQIDVVRDYINRYPRQVLRWTSTLRNYQTWMSNKDRRGIRANPPTRFGINPQNRTYNCINSRHSGTSVGLFEYR